VGKAGAYPSEVPFRFSTLGEWCTIRCKTNFNCTVYYITLNSNCEAERASKNLKKIVEDRVRSQK
jgi:hypothetical protein